MSRALPITLLLIALAVGPAAQTKSYVGADGKLRVALAKQPLSPNGPSKGPTTMAEGGIQKILADLGATVRVEEAQLTAEERHRVRRLEAARHVARPLRRHRLEERARRLLHGRPARDLSVDARARRRAAALGPDARADQDRHALARRASRLQHAGDDAQRIARRDAGRRGHRPRAAGDAARREARSAAVGSARRHGRRPAHRSARAAAARRLADRAAERRRPAQR